MSVSTSTESMRVPGDPLFTLRRMTTRTLEITVADDMAAQVLGHELDLLLWQWEHLRRFIAARGGRLVLDGEVLAPR